MKRIYPVVVSLLVICCGAMEAWGDSLPPSCLPPGSTGEVVSPPVSIGVTASSDDSEATDQERLQLLEALWPRLRDRLRECRARPAWSGELRVGAGTDGGGEWDAFHPTGGFVEGRLVTPPLFGGVTASAAARHFLGASWYWRDKRRVVLGLRVPMGRNFASFVDWERCYSVNDAFTMAGLVFRFGAR